MDTWVEWLPRVAAVLMALIGLTGLFKPGAITDGVGIQATKPLGVSELRGVLGGLNFGAAASALVMGDREVFIALGVAWACVTGARFISIAMDGTSFKDSIPPIVIDGTLAILFLSVLL